MYATALRVMTICNTNCFPICPTFPWFIPARSVAADLITLVDRFIREFPPFAANCLLQTPPISVFRHMFASIMLTRLAGLISAYLCNLHPRAALQVVAFPPPVRTHRPSRTRRVSTELNSNFASLLANPSLSSVSLSPCPLPPSFLSLSLYSLFL